ncbi:MAG: hypothetical protein Ta2E_02280 [Mycoplasmoidaceae bacterium]|nr:MAG: hypothetical protein Ta2E_02280 [Mycoplasmoidaceae bacterium]
MNKDTISKTKDNQIIKHYSAYALYIFSIIFIVLSFICVVCFSLAIPKSPVGYAVVKPVYDADGNGYDLLISGIWEIHKTVENVIPTGIVHYYLTPGGIATMCLLSIAIVLSIATILSFKLFKLHFARHSLSSLLCSLGLTFGICVMFLILKINLQDFVNNKNKYTKLFETNSFVTSVECTNFWLSLLVLSCVIGTAIGALVGLTAYDIVSDMNKGHKASSIFHETHKHQYSHLHKVIIKKNKNEIIEDIVI